MSMLDSIYSFSFMDWAPKHPVITVLIFSLFIGGTIIVLSDYFER